MDGSITPASVTNLEGVCEIHPFVNGLDDGQLNCNRGRSGGRDVVEAELRPRRNLSGSVSAKPRS